MADPRRVFAFDVELSGTTTTLDLYIPAGANRMLLAKVTSRNIGTISAFSFNGDALSVMTGSTHAIGSGSSRRAVTAYYLLAPDEGLHTLSITNSNSDSGTIRLEYWVDVDQSTPFPLQTGGLQALGATGTAQTSASQTLTTTTDDYCEDCIAASVTTLTPGGSQTVISGVGTVAYKSSGQDGASSSTTMSWSFASANYAHCAFAIRGAAATQPSPADYTGSRGKKSWHVATQLTGESLSAGSTTYVALVPSVETGTSSDTNRTRARQAGTYSDFVLRVSSNAATGGGTWTLQEDGVDTGITISIGAGVTGDIAATGGVLSVDGTTAVGWKCVAGTGGATGITALWCAFEPDGDDTVTQLGIQTSSAYKLAPATTTYLHTSGSRAANTTERKAQLFVPMDAAWEGAEVIKVGTTTSGAVSVKSRINGADGTQVLNWAGGGNASQEDTTHSDALDAGDAIAWQAASAAGTGDWEAERFCSRLLSADGEFLMVAGSGAGTGLSVSNGTQYIPVAGEMRITATEAAAALVVPFDCTVKRLAIDIGDNTSARGATFRLRVNGASVGPALHAIGGFPDRYYVNLDATVDLNAGDSVCLECVHAGTSNTLRVRSASFVAVERAASAASPVEQDLGGAYAVVNGAAQDLAGAYVVLNAATQDLGAAYAICGAVEQDLGGAYAVVNAVQQDLAGAYAVSGSAAQDLTVAYAVAGAVQQDCAGAFGVASTVQRDLSGGYDLLTSGTVTRDLGGAYTVSNTTAQDLAGTFGVQLAVAQDLAVAYAVAHAAQGDLAGAYAVANAAQQDRPGAYAILDEVHADMGAAWSMAGSVASDMAGGYTIYGGGGAGASPEEIAEAVWGWIIDGMAARGHVAVHTAALAGTSSGVGTDTEVYYGRDGVTPRLTVTFDSFNNRQTVVLSGA